MARLLGRDTRQGKDGPGIARQCIACVDRLEHQIHSFGRGGALTGQSLLQEVDGGGTGIRVERLESPSLSQPVVRTCVCCLGAAHGRPRI